MTISDAIRYVGVNDTDIDLFESQYPVPNGVSYNSYLLLDDKIALLDTVDKRKYDDWATKVDAVLDGRTPDYIVVHHLEPDHAGSLQMTIEKYPEATLVLSAKALAMLPQFFDLPAGTKTLSVKEGDTLELGHHTLTFVMAPMVHWPEVMVSYEQTEKVLFSADAFGKFGAVGTDEHILFSADAFGSFGALNGHLFDDEIDFECGWMADTRRYYGNIVGKYGAPVQTLLKKAAALDIATICPLHGPVLQGDLTPYLHLYNTWSSYQPEDEGVLVAYASIHGNTEKAAKLIAKTLEEKGAPKVAITDLTRDDMAEAIEDAFRYSKLIIAASSYDGGIFPPMEDFLNRLSQKAYQNRTVGLVENGSWAPCAARAMKGFVENMKNITICDNTVTIKSTLKDADMDSVSALVDEILNK